MKKRAFSFLSAAMLILMLLPVPASACDHCDEDGEPLKYVRQGYVAPDIGVPGYSGDYCCPECGAVVIQGWTLPALEDSSGTGGETAPTKEPGPTATPAPEPTKTPKPANTPSSD